MSPDEALVVYHCGSEAVVNTLCDFSNKIETQQMEIHALEVKIAKLSKNSNVIFWSHKPDEDVIIGSYGTNKSEEELKEKLRKVYPKL